MICSKTIFLESFHNIAFAYLLCPIMLKHLKNSLDRIMRYEVAKSWTKFGPNYQFSAKENFLVNLNVTFTYLVYPDYAN